MLVSSEQVLLGKFDTLLEEFWGFVGKCKLCLVQHNELFPSEEAFAASWLRGCMCGPSPHVFEEEVEGKPKEPFWFDYTTPLPAPVL